MFYNKKNMLTKSYYKNQLTTLSINMCFLNFIFEKGFCALIKHKDITL